MVSLYDIEVKIAGTKEVSLVDVLGYPSFSIWFSYCNFRCPWCQNWPIVIGKEIRIVKIRDIINEISESKFLIDYVHVTGGEPTLQAKALKALFSIVKNKLKLKNSLNTNGYNWEVIYELAKGGLIDHIAIDVKAPFSKPALYSRVVGLPNNKELISRIKKSIKISLKLIKFAEFRTTFVRPLSIDDLIEIAQDLKELGCNNNCYYVIQQFVPNPDAPNPEYRKGIPISASKLKVIAQEVKKKSELKNVCVRSLEEGVTTI